MRARSLTLLSAGTALVMVCSTAFSLSGGIYQPGFPRQAPSCGTCHNPSPGAGVGLNPIKVGLTPSARSIATSQAIQLTVTGSGAVQSGRGGFSMDATGGSFTAGQGTLIHAGGAAISHSNPLSRTWSFGYTAPASPGPVEVFVVVNMVNGNGLNDFGDHWAFHGADEKATVGTPVRLMVNATGVTAVGSSCVGGFGNFPVLGAVQPPAVGNGRFALDAVGLPPAAGTAFLVGTASPPIDLTPIGITGCTLHVSPLLVGSVVSSGDNSMRAEGTATMPIPIPNDPSLRGGKLRAQTVVIDGNSGRTIPVTLTNAIDISIN